MDGSIISYDSETGEGAISTDAGDHFTFSKDNWKGDRDPCVDDKVIFVAAEDHATDIFLRKYATGPFWKNPHIIGAAVIILGWILAGNLKLFKRLPNMSIMLGDRDYPLGAGVEFLRTLGTWMFLAIYLVPIFSGWLLYKSFTHSAAKTNKDNAAWSAILFPIFVPILGYFTIFIGLPGDFQFLIVQGISNLASSGMLGHTAPFASLHIDLGGALMLGGATLILLFRGKSGK